MEFAKKYVTLAQIDIGKLIIVFSTRQAVGRGGSGSRSGSGGCGGPTLTVVIRTFAFQIHLDTDMDNKHYESANAKDLKGGSSVDSVKELAANLAAYGDADTLEDGAHKTLEKMDEILTVVFKGIRESLTCMVASVPGGATMLA